ncbi:hypothetical protein BBJ28_00023205 [Nothophytophthora sp. Chile5]|nr:hypothetical protein BBJ28_00023205 [Nothophytophthora sp. Chile5]
MTAARLVYVLSPAKTLDLSAPRVLHCSQPSLLSDAHELIAQLRSLSQSQVKKLLGVSDALAKLNFDRFQTFDVSETATAAVNPASTLKQAALTFHGPAYQGLESQSLTDDDLEFAQSHLRILCGLYGMLRPLDLIQPYRLEMGQRLETKRGKDLYAFWGDALVSQIDALFREAEAEDESKNMRLLVNVASQEYFRSLPRDALEAADVNVVDCVFQDDGKIKSVYAKRARGLMCRYLIQQRVDSLEGITRFDLEGYKYSSTASNKDTLVFTRTAAAQKVALRLAQEKAQTKEKPKATVKTSKGDTSWKSNEKVAENESKLDAQEDGANSKLRRSSRKKRKMD